MFALGSLAVYAATGRLPFGRGTSTEVAHRVVYEPPDLAGCPARLLTLIEACLEKKAEARPAPGRVLEFCLARAAELTDPGSQPWPAWGLTAAAPEHSARSAGSTGSAGSAGSATAVLPELAQLAGGGPAAGGRCQHGQATPPACRRRLAAAILATAVIVIAMTSHLAAESTAAGSANASRHPVTRGATRAGSPTVPTSPSPSPVPAPPVVLLSQGHPVSASSVQGYQWAAAYAVDGNLGTRWSSAWSDPQWLEVDLGATHTVTKVVLYWERAYATAFQIQLSDNGTTWTDIYSTTTGTGGEQTLQVSGSGRYVRMYGTQRATQYGYSLWEFQVFGT